MKRDERGCVVKAEVPWAAVAAALVLLAAPTLGGCGGVIYAVNATSASSKLAQAKSEGAESKAPYEYYSAVEYMQKASEEASQAEYGDAIDYADAAEEHADKAIKLARDAHKGAGR